MIGLGGSFLCTRLSPNTAATSSSKAPSATINRLSIITPRKKPSRREGKARLFQHALVQTHNSVHLCSEPFIMRRDQRGAAFLADKVEELPKHDVGGRF